MTLMEDSTTTGTEISGMSFAVSKGQENQLSVLPRLWTSGIFQEFSTLISYRKVKKSLQIKSDK
jgi:hypothetical protein